MKIYDCFTFFNELELLDLRLKELYNYVDYFVLVEATLTHTGKTKDLIFEKLQSLGIPAFDQFENENLTEYFLGGEGI